MATQETAIIVNVVPDGTWAQLDFSGAWLDPCGRILHYVAHAAVPCRHWSSAQDRQIIGGKL